ncbi:MAG: hypothetical protein ACJ8AO_08950 [Gemmatimonadaceae bacterium]
MTQRDRRRCWWAVRSAAALVACAGAARAQGASVLGAAARRAGWSANVRLDQRWDENLQLVAPGDAGGRSTRATLYLGHDWRSRRSHLALSAGAGWQRIAGEVEQRTGSYDVRAEAVGAATRRLTLAASLAAQSSLSRDLGLVEQLPIAGQGAVSPLVRADIVSGAASATYRTSRAGSARLETGLARFDFGGALPGGASLRERVGLHRVVSSRRSLGLAVELQQHDTDQGASTAEIALASWDHVIGRSRRASLRVLAEAGAAHLAGAEETVGPAGNLSLEARRLSSMLALTARRMPGQIVGTGRVTTATTVGLAAAHAPARGRQLAALGLTHTAAADAALGSYALDDASLRVARAVGGGLWAELSGGYRRRTEPVVLSGAYGGVGVRYALGGR